MSGLHPQCKLDLESEALACESKACLSFQFSLQMRDLYAQRAAAARGARGCAVILPKVKLPPFSWIVLLLHCQAPSVVERWVGIETHSEKQDVKSLLSSAKRKNGGWHSGSASVLVRGHYDPWEEMAGRQEVGRGLNNYAYNVLTLYGFTLCWFKGIGVEELQWCYPAIINWM